jgi:hypothetical protein
VSLEVESKIDEATLAEEEATVPAPDVYMTITDRQNGTIAFARVGDPLTIHFGISDRDTPYDLYVRNLVALDGADGNEIVLIDEDGCPTDPEILGPVVRDDAQLGNRAHLKADFEAFKFPDVPVVYFRATIAFCINGPCEARTCQVRHLSYKIRKVYGKRACSVT